MDAISRKKGLASFSQKRFHPALSGICNAAQNIGQFAIVRIKHNYGSMMFFIELQIQQSSKRHYKCRLAGRTKPPE
jgi:hypothetical protein